MRPEGAWPAVCCGGEAGGSTLWGIKGRDPAVDYPFAKLQAAYGVQVVEDVVSHNLLVHCVAPGEELAHFVSNAAEDASRDVFGEVQKPASPESLLKVGDHVKLRDETYLAQIFGYALILNGGISVLPSVWSSPDHIAAHYIYFSQEGEHKNLTWEWLVQIFEAENSRSKPSTPYSARCQKTCSNWPKMLLGTTRSP